MNGSHGPTSGGAPSFSGRRAAFRSLHRPTFAMCFFGAVVAAMLLRVPAREHASSSAHYEDVYYLPAPAWLAVLSLGHQAALCDLLWIRAMLYAGDELIHRGEMQHVFDYTEAMLALDPDFEAVYRWIGTAGVYQPNAITRDDLVRTIALLEEGVGRMPDSGALQWDLGATYAFEAGPYASSPEERRAWLEAGAEHLMIATRLGAAPPWMVLSNTTLLVRVGERERAIEHLEEMYTTLSDPDMRAAIEARIAELQDDAYAEAFASEAREFEEAREQEFPYAAPSLYFVMGPKLTTDVQSAFRDGFAAHAFEDELDLGAID